MSGLRITADKSDADTTVLRLSGEFEGLSVLNAKPDLLGHVDRTEGTLAMDFGEISYIDSSGVGVLLEMVKRAQSRKSKFVLLNVHDPVRKVLAITKIDKLLTILG